MTNHPHHPVAAPGRGLHVCPACDRTFVVPLSVLDVLPDGRFPCVLACRNCGWHDARPCTDEELGALDGALDAISGAMEDTLDALTIADELARIDLFADALHSGLILPEDF
jgi:hypothetical protein